MDVLVFLNWYPLRSVHCECYGSNCCVAAVVCLACEDVVLCYGCVVVFTVVSVVKCSLRVLWQQLLFSSGSVAAIVFLACADVVLGSRCVVVFIVVSVLKRSLRVLWQQLLCSSGSVSCM